MGTPMLKRRFQDNFRVATAQGIWFLPHPDWEKFRQHILTVIVNTKSMFLHYVLPKYVHPKIFFRKLHIEKIQQTGSA